MIERMGKAQERAFQKGGGTAQGEKMPKPTRKQRHLLGQLTARAADRVREDEKAASLLDL